MTGPAFKSATMYQLNELGWPAVEESDLLNGSLDDATMDDVVMSVSPHSVPCTNIPFELSNLQSLSFCPTFISTSHQHGPHSPRGGLLSTDSKHRNSEADSSTNGTMNGTDGRNIYESDRQPRSMQMLSSPARLISDSSSKISPELLPAHASLPTKTSYDQPNKFTPFQNDRTALPPFGNWSTDGEWGGRLRYPPSLSNFEFGTSQFSIGTTSEPQSIGVLQHASFAQNNKKNSVDHKIQSPYREKRVHERSPLPRLRKKSLESRESLSPGGYVPCPSSPDVAYFPSLSVDWDASDSPVFKRRRECQK